MSLRERARRAPLPVALLALAFVLVGAWTWTWPDHPLIPDEAIAKAMADSVAEHGTPFAREPFDDYRPGTFATDRYGRHYADHAIAQPPTPIASAYEQGLLGPKAGRLVTLALGTFALAYLAHRIAGPWAGFFGGLLYLVHPATLYFHQSYFSNPGGAAWFLVSLALLEGARRRWWLAPLSLAASGVCLAFRVEYGLGYLAVVPLAALVLRDRRALLAYYGTLVVGFLALWNLSALLPGLTLEKLFRQAIPLDRLLADPLGALRDVLHGTFRDVTDDARFDWATFLQNANDYFPYFFPITAILAVAGLFARARDPAATWTYAPLALHALLQGYAILPNLGGRDYSGVSWLESSVARYFLAAYAATALLAGVALGTWAQRLQESREGARAPARRRGATAAAAVAVGAMLVGASVAGAMQADHGVAWANERRAWFDDIDAAAAALGEDAVFVGKTPGKVIFSRPLMNPENVRWNWSYVSFVAQDLLAKGYRVHALEPWYWSDHGYSMERMLISGGHAYWTDTGVVVPCGCGEFARFYELHATNATLDGVARLERGAFRETPGGLLTTGDASVFYPHRLLHLEMGLAKTRGVLVDVRYHDADNGTHEAGFWNLPLDEPKNRHPLVTWQGTGTGANKTVTFRIPPEQVANGGLYVAGDPLLVRALVVREG